MTKNRRGQETGSDSNQNLQALRGQTLVGDL